jgi:primary-amine oxidase
LIPHPYEAQAFASFLVKVDLDVAGTANSLMHTYTTREETTQPWFMDDWGTTVIQSRINRKIIENEDDALLKYPLNFQGGYALVNTNATNSWGMPRGYAIHPGYSPIHTVRLPESNMIRNEKLIFCCDAEYCWLKAAA